MKRQFRLLIMLLYTLIGIYFLFAYPARETQLVIVSLIAVGNFALEIFLHKGTEA